MAAEVASAAQVTKEVQELAKEAKAAKVAQEARQDSRIVGKPETDLARSTARRVGGYGFQRLNL